MTAPTTDSDKTDDDTGLADSYDVIVCGTGLVQSIVAAALARANCRVLHVDAADYYGELNAVWTFPYLQELYKKKKEKKREATAEAATLPELSDKTDGTTSISLAPDGDTESLRIHSLTQTTIFPMVEGTAVATPFGVGIYQGLHRPNDDSYASVEIALSNWTLANGTCAKVHVGVPRDVLEQDDDALQVYLATMHDIQPVVSRRAQAILQTQSRSLALDVTPGLVFASGAAVQGLLQSSVSDYLEFKSIEGLLWHTTDSQTLEPVPCSKNDVFATNLLTPMEKRRLVKFLQLVHDFTTIETAEDETAEDETVETAAFETDETSVQFLNERHLNQGRSLARPQNKAVQTNDMARLQECMDDNMDFGTYLTQEHKLSEKLRSLVCFALALCTSNTVSLREGMCRLGQHLQALGRFGSTAFLVPLYGSGELPQAFCRSAAVYGATYLLRRAPLQIILGNDNDGSTVQGVVLQGDIDNENEVSSPSPAPRQMIRCSHVIVPEGALLPRPSCSKRVLRQISILTGKPIATDNNQQRHVVIFPPDSFDNSDTIHGIVLDETVNVAPHVHGGCSVVHLTTTVDEASVDEDTMVDDGVLKQAMDSILSSDNGSHGTVQEICQVVFSYKLYDNTHEVPSHNGMHVIHRSRPDLAVDEAFEQAREIFTRICPTVDFLALSEEMDAKIKERLGDAPNEEDDEQLVLESAMGIIDVPAEEEGS